MWTPVPPFFLRTASPSFKQLPNTPSPTNETACLAFFQVSVFLDCGGSEFWFRVFPIVDVFKPKVSGSGTGSFPAPNGSLFFF